MNTKWTNIFGGIFKDHTKLVSIIFDLVKILFRNLIKFTRKLLSDQEGLCWIKPSEKRTLIIYFYFSGVKTPELHQEIRNAQIKAPSLLLSSPFFERHVISEQCLRHLVEKQIDFFLLKIISSCQLNFPTAVSWLKQVKNGSHMRTCSWKARKDF